MAVSNVELIVNATKAINPLREVERQTKRLQTSFTDLRKTVNNFQSAIAGVGFGLLSKQVISAAASFNDLQTRLKLLTAEYGEFEDAQRLAAKAAKTFGLSNREATAGVANIFARLRPLGVSLRDIESTFIGFNTVVKLSNTSTIEASAGFTQLAQALGSGRLQGDEFRSVSEQIPGILQAISKETGIAAGDLKDYASEGKLTSDIVINALKRIEREGADAIGKIVENSDIQKFKNFQNAVDSLQVAIGQRLLPVVTPLIESTTELIKQASKIPAPASQLAIEIGLVTGGVIALTKAVEAFLATKLAAAIGTQIAMYKTFGAQIYLTAAAQNALNLAVKGFPIAIAALAIGSLIKSLYDAKTAQERFNTAISDGSVESLKAAIAIEEETISVERNKGAKMSLLGINAKLLKSQQRLTKLRQALAEAEGKPSKLKPKPKPEKEDDPPEGKADMSQRLLDLNNQLRAAQEAEQQRLAATLRLMVEKQKISESTLGPVAKEDALQQAIHDFRQEIFKIDKQIADQRADDIAKAAEGFEAQMAHQDELRQAIAEQKSQYEELNTTFRNGIVDSILAAVEGTKSLSESLVGVLKQMARLILQQQLLNALSGFNIFGGGGSGAGGGFGVTPATSGFDFSGAFANGGRPAVGKAALVGERGPELFVPDRAGTIIPNHALGGANVTVNVDASGSSVEGDADQASQLGKAIGIAVQAELIKQKRPGGLLS